MHITDNNSSTKCVDFQGNYQRFRSLRTKGPDKNH
jgi:hypothetical protein